MKREYKLAKGWAIFMYIFAPVLAVLFGWLALFTYFYEPINWILATIFTPLGLFFVGIMVVAFLDIRKGTFVVEDEKVYTTSSLKFYCRSLYNDEIKGFKSDDKYLYIVPKDEKKKSILVSKYLGNQDEICLIIGERFDDLDQLEFEKEAEEILTDETLGETVIERQDKLNTAFTVAKVLNWGTGFIAAWVIFKPEPYQYAIIACSVAFIITVIVAKFFPLIRLYSDKVSISAYPSVFWAVMTSAIGIGLRALLDFEIYDYRNLWMPLVVLSLLMWVIVLFRNKQFSLKGEGILVSLVLLIFVVVYAYGIIIHINCQMDTSQPQRYAVTVKDKTKTSGKHTSYHLSLTQWGKHEEGEEVTVTQIMYKETEIGDEIEVQLYKGEIEIPWFELFKK